jgi:hypothetical protein
MHARLLRSLALAAFATTLALLRPGAAAAEEADLRVFSAWQAEGQIMQTGPESATYMGMLAGRVYVDTEQGPIDSGEVACPIVIQVKLKERTQSGSGHCTFTGLKGNRIYMDLSCTGAPFVGCAGESTLTGGTGPFAKVEGGGHFVLRGSLHELAMHPDTAVLKDTTTGIIFWQHLHYKIP